MIDFKTTLDDLQTISGIDIPVEGLGLTIHQPRINEIAILGQHNYFIALQVFRLNKQMLKVQTPEATDWAIFCQSVDQKITGIKSTRALVTNFLQLFMKDKIMIGPRSLIVTTPEGIVNIEPEDFPKFQQLISNVGGASILQPQEETFNPKNRRAAEIAEKMKKARSRLAKVKTAESGIPQEAEGFLARYVRAVATVTANSLEQVSNMTLHQLTTVMQTYLAWEAYDLEIKSRLAGAKSDKQLVHWMMQSDKQDDNIGTI